MITVYGIPNCDTVRRARKWLAAEGIAHAFHDFRKDGVDEAQIAAWADELGWEILLNRRGTTWRKLPDADKTDIDADTAAALMVAHPAMIKRPVFDVGARRLVGFNTDIQEDLKRL